MFGYPVSTSLKATKICSMHRPSHIFVAVQNFFNLEHFQFLQEAQHSESHIFLDLSFKSKATCVPFWLGLFFFVPLLWHYLSQPPGTSTELLNLKETLAGEIWEGRQRKRVTSQVSEANFPEENKVHFHLEEVTFFKREKQWRNLISHLVDQRYLLENVGELCESRQIPTSFSLLKVSRTVHQARNNLFPHLHNKFLALIGRNHFWLFLILNYNSRTKLT